MTSWEFAERRPVLSVEEAERILRAHDHDPAEARAELAERFTETAELLGWLGY
ncbi:hypothetical protein RM190_22765 [Paracoccus sp. CPCC 101403]|uniref:Uncharacterized protein n=1 Tax=Paracoccus broussonetiae TaxID=3075834 RepID=A0ABU3EKC2_9RHOB|nr:hypothetical protein [Paracoccus sp. CPCC 101403]MDT1064696.1 hypothetical protein [Paracoccus sp. CPCC 101403]